MGVRKAPALTLSEPERKEPPGEVGAGGGAGMSGPPGGKKKKSHGAAEQGGYCLCAALRFPGRFPPAGGPLATATGGGRAGRTLGSCGAGFVRPARPLQPRSGRRGACVPHP